MTERPHRKCPPGSGLVTPRQREVLARRAMGYTNKEVSDQLGLSVQTVKNHQTASFAQLDVQGLVMALRALGWVVLPDDDVLRPSSIRRQRV